MSNGINPLRWDCEKHGCFNVKCRPKIEIFADCFPGKINFGDTDAIVEINSHFLMLEWKHKAKEDESIGTTIKIGQQLLYERLTADERFTVVVVCGDAEVMTINSCCVFKQGKQSEWMATSLDIVKKRMKAWARKARSQR